MHAQQGQAIGRVRIYIYIYIYIYVIKSRLMSSVAFRHPIPYNCSTMTPSHPLVFLVVLYTVVQYTVLGLSQDVQRQNWTWLMAVSHLSAQKTSPNLVCWCVFTFTCCLTCLLLPVSHISNTIPRYSHTHTISSPWVHGFYLCALIRSAHSSSL